MLSRTWSDTPSDHVTVIGLTGHQTIPDKQTRYFIVIFAACNFTANPLHHTSALKQEK